MKFATSMVVWRVMSYPVRLLTGVMMSMAAPVMAQEKGKAESILESFDLRGSAATHARLPRGLQEVSGLAVTGDGRVFAHGDERGVISQVDPCTGTVQKAFSLGKPATVADFEGIAIAGERFFLITSTGILYETREGANGDVVPFTRLDTGFGKFCELEGLAWDSADRTLLIGCKTPAIPALRNRMTLVRWSVDRRAPASPPLSIPLAALAAAGVKSFHPAAVEREARTGHILIVAGRQRQLLEVTAQGVVIATRSLNRQRHGQPEGLTLLGDSVLVIADEAGTGGGRAAITCYRRGR
ncbi:MAG: hypothetical protein ACT4P7_02280 [Gemmatimonadaceae bacterium]